MPEQQVIQCLIVDDEPPAREILRRYIEQVPTLRLDAECGNAIEAFTLLQQKQIDLLFLDVRMPQLNGNDLLKALKNPPKVIFTTAYPEYALEGFELDAVDYLLKPVTFERFLRSVQKAYQLSAFKVPELGEPGIKSDPFVYFRVDRKMIKVMLHDINYIESMKDYVKIFTKNGIIITKQSITSVEAMLPDKYFVRTHRSYIVSLDKIKSFTSELIEVDNTEVPIGKLFRNSVMKVLG